MADLSALRELPEQASKAAGLPSVPYHPPFLAARKLAALAPHLLPLAEALETAMEDIKHTTFHQGQRESVRRAAKALKALQEALDG